MTEYIITDEQRKKMLRLWSVIQQHIDWQHNACHTLDLTVQDAYNIMEQVHSNPYNPQAEPCSSFIPNDFYRKSDGSFCVEKFCQHWKPEKRKCIDLDPAAGSTYSVEEAHCELRKDGES